MTGTDALQAALQAEFEVIYGYGVVGAHLSGAAENYASSRLTTHMLRRDRLGDLITAQGAVPATTRAAYALPFVVNGVVSARRLGAHLELGAADAAWDLIAASPRRTTPRTLGVGWMTDTALSAALWGGTQPLPGQPV